MPSSLSFFSLSTSTSRFLYCLASALASSARKLGWHRFGGRLPRSRVSAMPLAMAWPWAAPRSVSAISVSSTSRVIFFSAGVSAFSLLKRSNT
ncbi:hypothetical protein D3C75_821000 [compost metagenome]